MFLISNGLYLILYRTHVILGDLPETYFLFRNNPKARAEDLNKFHFGVVGKSFWMFSEEFMLKTA